MKEYIIKYDYGYGMEYDVIEAENLKAAEGIAYDTWRECAENQADYGVIGEATPELKEEWDV